jgi:hypothetical protein
MSSRYPMAGPDDPQLIQLQRLVKSRDDKRAVRAEAEFPLDEVAAEYPTKAAAYIFQKLLPEWSQDFLDDNAAYGEDPAPLGPSGEFVEIWRKAKKLRRALWDCEEIGSESAREVAMDLVGHCFLLITLIDEEREGAVRAIEALNNDDA